MVLIDAWRHDMVLESTTPYLHGLARKGVRCSIMEPFGFNTGPSFFAGLYPERSNQIQKFVYNPKGSPYRFTRYIPEFLLHLPRGSGRISSMIEARARAMARRAGNTAAQHFVDYAPVPFKFKQYFDLSEQRNLYEPGALEFPTVFDTLRQVSASFLYIGVPDFHLSVETNLKDFASGYRGDESFVFIHFSEPDWVEHEFGPSSEEYREALSKVDAAVSRIHETMQTRQGSVHLLAFGDHGAADVTRHVNVQAALQALPWKPHRDYIYFLDSTQVRFWYLDPACRSDIHGALEALGAGEWLTDDDKIRYRLPQDHGKHFEDLFILKEGGLIRPDFFHHPMSPPVKGMHGYRPESPANMASCVVVPASGGTARELDDPRPMVDLFPTALDLMGLPVPESSQGKSLVG